MQEGRSSLHAVSTAPAHSVAEKWHEWGRKIVKKSSSSVTWASSSKIGNEVGVCFLAPKFAGKQDRVELACATLAKQIGAEAVKTLSDALRKAGGDQVKGTTMISLLRPGDLSHKSQKDVMASLIAAARQSKFR